MSKGEQTRLAVLDEALSLARRVGLNALTIGSLAEQAQLSKSGLFAHFRSKQALQVAVLAHARESFEAAVARPALRTPRGEARLRELFERWLAWDGMPGGCPFVAAAIEFDDQPGPVRDQVVRDQLDLFDLISTVFRTGISTGQFRADADAEQFTQEFYGIILACHHAIRLLGDENAEARARQAFERLVQSVRVPDTG